MTRKSVPWKTVAASLLLERGDIPYEDAKQMTADQMCSLYQRDHNRLHAFDKHKADVDHFTNITMRLIAEHRTKTKHDRKIIAKSDRLMARYTAMGAYVDAMRGGPVFKEIWQLAPLKAEGQPVIEPSEELDRQRRRRLRSRGFDKSKTRKMDGTVVPRKK